VDVSTTRNTSSCSFAELSVLTQEIPRALRLGGGSADVHGSNRIDGLQIREFFYSDDLLTSLTNKFVLRSYSRNVDDTTRLHPSPDREESSSRPLASNPVQETPEISLSDGSSKDSFWRSLWEHPPSIPSSPSGSVSRCWWREGRRSG